MGKDLKKLTEYISFNKMKNMINESHPIIWRLGNPEVLSQLEVKAKYEKDKLCFFVDILFYFRKESNLRIFSSHFYRKS